MSEPTKQCTKCKTILPATTANFARHGAGLRPDCKKCRKAQNAARYKANPGKILAKNQEWREANRDKVAAQVKKWNAEHPERRQATLERFKAAHPHKNNEYISRWRAKHREQYNDLDKAYRDKNRVRVRELAAKARASDPIRFRTYQHNRRELVRAGGTFTSEDITAQYTKQCGRCAWCSCTLNNVYEIDHVIPLIRGGSNKPENLVCSCPSCNRRKSKSLPYSEWQPPKPLKI